MGPSLGEAWGPPPGALSTRTLLQAPRLQPVTSAPSPSHARAGHRVRLSALCCQHPATSLVTPTLLIREVTARSGLSPMDGGIRSLLGWASSAGQALKTPFSPAQRPLPASSLPDRGDVLGLSPSHCAIFFRLSAQYPCIPLVGSGCSLHLYPLCPSAQPPATGHKPI